MKFPTFDGTRGFITITEIARNYSVLFVYCVVSFCYNLAWHWPISCTRWFHCTPLCFA